MAWTKKQRGSQYSYENDEASREVYNSYSATVHSIYYSKLHMTNINVRGQMFLAPISFLVWGIQHLSVSILQYVCGQFWFFILGFKNGKFSQIAICGIILSNDNPLNREVLWEIFYGHDWNSERWYIWLSVPASLQ